MNDITLFKITFCCLYDVWLLGRMLFCVYHMHRVYSRNGCAMMTKLHGDS